MSANPRILLVVNPISGGRNKGEMIDFLTEKIVKEKNFLSTFFTSGENDRRELKSTIQDFRPDRILVIGGDGTIKLVGELLQDTEIPIGLIPAGSANGLAENLDLPSGLEDLLEIALGNNFIKMDCITINGEICLHISDIGLNAELIKNYEEGNIRGKLGYLLHSIPTLIESDFPFQFKISLHGETFYRQGFLLGIANARKYGTGAIINPKGRIDDGHFEILVFKKFNIPEILRTFQENASFSEDFMEIFPAKEAIIECEKNLPFQVDGEYRGEVKRVEAQISHLKLKVAVPKIVQKQTPEK